MAAAPQRVAQRRQRPDEHRENGLRIPEMQRSRLLAAAVASFDELGYESASVAQITGRARISRRTFYELFGNREECFVEVLESAIEQITVEIALARLNECSWCERVRGSLAVILDFFDREPALARVCLLQTQRASQRVLERRQEILGALASVVDEGRRSFANADASELTAQIVVGGVVSILDAHLLAPRRGSARDLLGELMAMIVLPYAGSRAARRERELTNRVPRSQVEPAPHQDGRVQAESFDRLAQIPMRLTYRTARVLRDIGEHPGSSNRQVAERVEIHDQGQVSKLLARLQRLGLIANAVDRAPARGEANEWHLTETGEQIVTTIRVHEHDGSAPVSDPDQKARGAASRAPRNSRLARGSSKEARR